MILLLANAFLLWSLCVAQLNEVSQPVSLQTLNLGDSATIECYIRSHMTKRVWYKLTTERKLQLVASFDSHYHRCVLSDEFDWRYSVYFDKVDSHLSIAATSWDDVGTYFCGVMHLNDIQFGSGTFLMLKGAKMISDSVVQQPDSQSVQSGDSVTLSCSVHSGQCPAEHISVRWLKNSDHSAPEMIYSSGNQNNTCQTVSGVASCVNNLLIRNFSYDDAGIYHCVVTSCGQILFGSGTKLISDYGMDFRAVPNTIFLVLIIFLSLALILCFMCWTKCCDCTESRGGFSASTTTSAEIQDGEHLKITELKSQRDDTWSECMYLSVKKYN